MNERVTIDDVYEIAAEVAEDTITKFLQNLVKLIPAAETVVEDIRDSQYEELKRLRQGKLQESRKPLRPVIPTDNFDDPVDREFNAIAHPSSQNSNNLDIDDALSQIPLERSDLFGQANSSEVDSGSIVPMDGV